MNYAAPITETQAEVLTQLAQAVEREHDPVSAGKLRDLAHKLAEPFIEIAFCGHFSAGKSSLINKLCGHSLLPSGPIPTSANIVSIRNGESRAVVLNGKGEMNTVPLDELEAHCRNGDDIEEVRITHPLTSLGEYVTLLDTPGIDSTDDAHELATRSVLHRADAIFYVMDYNHVQSELNFTFMKSMIDRGKPVYAVVNMIDKHRDAEMSFAEYRQGVEDALASWGVRPAGIFYISVKDERTANNEWVSLLKFIRELPAAGPQLKSLNVCHSALAVIDEHMRVLEERNAPRKQELVQQLDEEEQASLLHQLAELKEKLESVRREAHQFYEECKKQIERMIENANVTPAATRDRAQRYLESRQSGFKVGWLRSGSKTKAERQRRLAEFAEDFAEQVRVHLVFHLADQLRRLVSQVGVQNGDGGLSGEIGEPSSPVTPDWLASRVHPGASGDGEYTLNYCRLIAADAKSALRRQALTALETIAHAVERKNADEADRLRKRAAELEQRLGAANELRMIDEKLQERERELRSICERLRPADEEALFPVPVKEEVTAATESRDQDIRRVPLSADSHPMLAARSAPDAEPGSAAIALSDKRKHLFEAASTLREAYRLIRDVPALESVAEAIVEKAQRLEDSRFTIALFGAFSAGKSSFANALIGQAVLPTSPNPTTAAINRIVPPTEEWAHGTAKVAMKTEERLLEELNYSLDVLGFDRAKDLPQALTVIRRIDPQRFSAKARTHVAFLQAVGAGWDTAKDLLGSAVKADLQEFARFAAVESKSCFVEEIALHYDCPLTRAGIVLVDTPGADSINARHTGVAFNYIKNADAILFVTYYNHAFSRADEDFLHQLGRVKDRFELDKMFFIVNAADLAASDEELAHVVDHVKSNLLAYGIREPRIHALSSALALVGKKGDADALSASSFTPFEEQFYSFIYEDLTELIVQAAARDVERALSGLRMRCEMARQSSEEKALRAERLRRAMADLSDELADVGAEREARDLEQEIAELVYYARQRVQHRFSESFRLAFNPSALRADLGSLDQAVIGSWKELIGRISIDASQEMLATTLRLEQFIRKRLDDRLDVLSERISARIDGFSKPSLAEADMPTCRVEQDLGEIPVENRRLLALFKNPKHFFEGDGRARMQSELEPIIMKAIDDYAERHAANFTRYYGELLRTHASRQTSDLASEMRRYLDGLLESLGENGENEAFEERICVLEQLHDKLLK